MLALVVARLVADRLVADRVVLDAGTKCLTSDGAGTPDWTLAAGWPDLRLEFLSEEHAVARFTFGSGVAPPRIGDRIAPIPSHICPVMNPFDVAYGVSGGVVVAKMPVVARGKCR